VKDHWSQRLAYFKDIIDTYNPDVACLQELITEHEAKSELGGMLPGHTILNFRGEFGEHYPDATIYVRDSMFEVVKSGNFWLSPTPDEPFSRGFAKEGLQLPRVVQWAHLKNRQTGLDFVTSCTHFDNNSPSQEKSADLLLGRLMNAAGGDGGSEKDSIAVVAMGDFNSQNCSEPSYGSSAHYNNSEAYKRLNSIDGDAHRPNVWLKLTEAYDVAESRRFDNRTKSVASTDLAREDENSEVGYDKDVADVAVGGQRIDHVFLYPGDKAKGNTWTVSEYIVDDSTYGPLNRAPSDHRPVVVRATLNAGKTQ